MNAGRASLVAVTLMGIVVSATGAPSAHAATQVIDRAVHRILQAGDRADVVIEVKQGINALEIFRGKSFPDRSTHITALKAELGRVSWELTRPVMAFLNKLPATDIEVKKFWIHPRVIVKNADGDLLMKLASLPSVEAIREEVKIEFAPLPTATASSGGQWGIDKIGARQMWADGIVGEGVRVGAIDTGARATHVALKKCFASEYGWFNTENNTAEMVDPVGHGTHVVGTIAGSKGIGVAPAAKWMMCKASREQVASEADLLECAQWMLCPTLADGSKPDCGKAPRVINNSWGGPANDTWFKPMVDAWIEAGIIPVFSSGDTGSSCSTTTSPGDYRNVIGVGASMKTDELNKSSSKGPGMQGQIKPDITAPGDDIRSASAFDDNEYALVSGTSMASAHVTGAIALLLSQEPELTIDEIKVRLYATTDQKLPSTNFTCGGTSDEKWPNNQFGHGRMNIFNAYQEFRPPQTTSASPTL